jgi:hypothetical protein
MMGFHDCRCLIKATSIEDPMSDGSGGMAYISGAWIIQFVISFVALGCRYRFNFKTPATWLRLFQGNDLIASLWRVSLPFFFF